MGTFDQKYQSIRRLGEGGFGVVWLVKRKADGQVRLTSCSPQSSLGVQGTLYRRVSGHARSLTYVCSPFRYLLSSTCLATTDVRSQDVQDGYERQGHAVQADRYRDRTAETPLTS
jgi:serine/threonine protein kinase